MLPPGHIFQDWKSYSFPALIPIIKGDHGINIISRQIPIHEVIQIYNICVFFQKPDIIFKLNGIFKVGYYGSTKNLAMGMRLIFRYLFLLYESQENKKKVKCIFLFHMGIK